MLKEQIINQVSEQFAKVFKNNPFQDVQKNLKSILQATLDKMDIVTREEFELQQKVLVNTRMQLEELEQKIQKLEQKSSAVGL